MFGVTHRTIPPKSYTHTVKQTALITGASGGIGLELARLFAGDGWDVVLVARSDAKLRDLAAELGRQHGITAQVIIADLAKPDAAADIVKTLTDRGLIVDALVNNAGYGLTGPFVETDLRLELEMIQVNVAAITHLTKLLLPGMVARRRGRILNVASTVVPAGPSHGRLLRDEGIRAVIL